jgi:hypothetical protein
MLKTIFGFFSLIFLVYLILPGPTSVEEFPSLPGSVKSTLDGDTWQVPNVVGYFSNNYRDFATDFYKKNYQRKTLFPFGPIKLNHPPEFAYTAIKDQTQSTYLEEFIYPLRDSLYVNGMEPFEQNGQPKFEGATKFAEGGQGLHDTKVTLRYYPSPLWARLLTWLGVNLAIFLLWKVIRRVLKND